MCCFDVCMLQRIKCHTACRHSFNEIYGLVVHITTCSLMVFLFINLLILGVVHAKAPLSYTGFWCCLTTHLFLACHFSNASATYDSCCLPVLGSTIFHHDIYVLLVWSLVSFFGSVVAKSQSWPDFQILSYLRSDQVIDILKINVKVKILWKSGLCTCWHYGHS